MCTNMNGIWQRSKVRRFMTVIQKITLHVNKLTCLNVIRFFMNTFPLLYRRICVRRLQICIRMRQGYYNKLFVSIALILSVLLLCFFTVICIACQSYFPSIGIKCCWTEAVDFKSCLEFWGLRMIVLENNIRKVDCLLYYWVGSFMARISKYKYWWHAQVMHT